MNCWNTSTSLVRRVAAFCAIFAAVALAGCDGATGSGSSSSVASTTATADAVAVDPVSFSSGAFSIAQSSGTVSVTVMRSGAASSAATVDFATVDGTAVAGTDYTAVGGTLSWAENDTITQTISIPVSNATPFSGVRSFTVVLTNPTGSGANIGNPGSATVTISGNASNAAGAVELSGNSYSIAQQAATMTLTVNRTGGSSGAVSVAYATSDATAVAGTDYTAASGILSWEDGDAASKTFAVAISTANAFAGNKTFSVTLSDARSGATVGTPASAAVTIVGSGSAPAGNLELSSSSYTVAQSSGTMKISVSRLGGSNGAVSVSYGTANGTAAAGTDFTGIDGTLSWADGDTSPKTFPVAIDNIAPFAGSLAFKVALWGPSTSATIGNPGAATITINGGASTPAGSLELSGSNYTVGQAAGSVTVTVKRIGGASGAATATYATSNGTAVAGTDYTATTGRMQWASDDASAKTISIPVSNSTPFSGTRSFSIALTTATGGTLASPKTASVAINGDAAAATGSLQLSTGSYTVAQSAGNLTVTVNRTGGSSGSIGVMYATSDGTAVAGTDYTAANGTLQWADGDATSKSFSIAISNSTAFSGTRAFSIALSNPTSGATLSSPNSGSVTIMGSATSSPALTGTVFWVYHNGVFNWAGDYSWNATANYKDTAGGPTSGPYDIAVTIVSQYGGFQPFAFPYGGTPFNTTPYKYLIYSLKPTKPNQVYSTGIDANNDVPDGTPINIVGVPGGPPVTKYGPTPVVGQWASYKIPLADFGLTNPMILKFSIADGTGDPTNLFYVDDVGFTTE